MDSISDKKFLMIFAVVMGILAAIGIGVAIIANVVGSVSTDYKKSEGQVQLAADRIAPVGQVNLASDAGKEAVVTTVTKAVATPESLYNSACAACHTSGVAGAPKLGDKGGWANRLSKGFNALVGSAINGIGIMPARGGSSLSDEEMRGVVEYMLDTVK